MHGRDEEREACVLCCCCCMGIALRCKRRLAPCAPECDMHAARIAWRALRSAKRLGNSCDTCCHALNRGQQRCTRDPMDGRLEQT